MCTEVVFTSRDCMNLIADTPNVNLYFNESSISLRAGVHLITVRCTPSNVGHNKVHTAHSGTCNEGIGPCLEGISKSHMSVNREIRVSNR